MTQFVIIDEATRRVIGGQGRRDPVDMTGPPDPMPDAAPGTVLVAWQGALNFSGGIGVMEWLEGATEPSWRDDRTIEGARAPAIAKTYSDVDAVVWDAVGNRTEEYKEAEADARAYKAGSYVGNAPDSVACYALHNPTGVAQTGQWAADDIIARADAFASAKLAMRQNRFASQASMRAAATNAEVDAAAAAWTSFIAGLRAELGLQPPQGTQ